MRKWYPWLLVGLAFGFSAALYGRLPDRITTLWGPAGAENVDTSRAWAAWLMPAVLLAIAVITPRLPALDPLRANYAKFRSSYDLVINGVMTMIALLHGAMLASGVGYPVSIGRLTTVASGLLFILVGNVMPRARPNWLFGVRTPWTMSNDRVWERTHRVAGILFVLAGVVVLLSGFTRQSLHPPIFVGSVALAGIVSVVYSYFAWKQETARAPRS